MPPHLRVQQRQLALRLRAGGWSLREIGLQAGCLYEQVQIIARRAPRRPVRRDGWVLGPGRLTLADREEISIGVWAGESFTAIAARLQRAVCTVSREVAANGGGGQYRAWRAHQRARAQARRPKACKLACPQLAAQVTRWLQQWWSPVQISQRVADRVPKRSHDVGEPRNHLPGAIRPGPRRAAPGAGPVPALGPG